MLALAGLLVSILWGGISARPEPSRIETWLAGAMRRAANPGELEFEASSAPALLGHLAGMPAFAAGLAEAWRQLAVVSEPLRAGGSDLELAPAGSPEPVGGRLLARQPLALAEGPYELRFRTGGARWAEAARRSVAVLGHGDLDGAIGFRRLPARSRGRRGPPCGGVGAWPSWPCWAAAAAARVAAAAKTAKRWRGIA